MSGDERSERVGRRRGQQALQLAFTVVPLLIAGYGIAQFHGFVQDDAYISLRYAANLADGRGLVFNPGEHVEGFSNPAWTLLGAALLALGLPALDVWVALGVFFALVSVALVQRIARRIAGPLGGLAAGCLIAGSTTLHAWAGSGLETTCFTALLLAAILAHGRDRNALAFGLLGAAQWVRPEAAMAALLLLYVRVRGAVTVAGFRREALLPVLRETSGYLLPALALAGIRWWQFGALVPNTYLVKGAAGLVSHELGVAKWKELASWDHTVWVIVAALAALAPAWRRMRGWALVGIAALLGGALHGYIVDAGYLRAGWNIGEAASRGAYDAWALLSGLIVGLAAYVGIACPRHLSERSPLLLAALCWLGFVYYYVRIGGDILPMHRLFLPGLALQALLAVAGARRLIAWSSELAAGFGRAGLQPGVAEVRSALVGTGLVLTALAVGQSVALSMGQRHYRGTRVALEAAHGAAGRDLQAIAETHGFEPVALAHDMGALPASALDVRFADAIGLTDRRVAELLWEHRYSPYVRHLLWREPAQRAQLLRLDRSLRAYFSELRPDYVVINAHLPPDVGAAAREAARAGDAEFFAAYVAANPFFAGWAGSASFQRDYVMARAYEFSPVVFLVTYRRADRPELLPPP
jgi:hypothetical protein